MGTVREGKFSTGIACIIHYGLLQTSPSTSQALLSNAEHVAKVLSETLGSDDTEVIKTGPNIGNWADYKQNVVISLTTFPCMFVYSYQSWAHIKLQCRWRICVPRWGW